MYMYSENNYCYTNLLLFCFCFLLGVSIAEMFLQNYMYVHVYTQLKK
jgi:hypothetical protein